MQRIYRLPENLAHRVHAALEREGLALSATRDIAACVRQLSDYFIAKPEGQTPWHERWARIAYAVWFHPLNLARNLAVADAGSQVGFFAGLEQHLDFGSGSGAVSAALAGRDQPAIRSARMIERAAGAAAMHRLLAPDDGPDGGPDGRPEISWFSDQPKDLGAWIAGRPTLVSFSYSLTELQALPRWTSQAEALMLVEPSTRDDGRRLSRFRDELLAQGWYAWAPCTHQKACPLTAHSAKDWCHDRIVFEAPRWFAEIEQHLPMRNRTLTFSYLLLRRSAPPGFLGGLARLTGDQMTQKGQTRQMICRGPDREFLSWQHRRMDPPELPRGMLVKVAANVEIKGHELRPSAAGEVACFGQDSLPEG